MSPEEAVNAAIARAVLTWGPNERHELCVRMGEDFRGDLLQLFIDHEEQRIEWDLS